jgi:hypothetical protein
MLPIGYRSPAESLLQHPYRALNILLRTAFGEDVTELLETTCHRCKHASHLQIVEDALL